MVLWTTVTKKIIELTVSGEDRCDEADERKKAKYDELMASVLDEIYSGQCTTSPRAALNTALTISGFTTGRRHSPPSEQHSRK
ncbi:hypothetical protein ScPMuIL_009383 [Solemya velum]